MKCSICGGRVEWQGPLSNPTRTKCLSCGEINCQEVDPPLEDEADESDTANLPGIAPPPHVLDMMESSVVDKELGLYSAMCRARAATSCSRSPGKRTRVGICAR